VCTGFPRSDQGIRPARYERHVAVLRKRRRRGLWLVDLQPFLSPSQATFKPIQADDGSATDGSAVRLWEWLDA